MLRFIPLFFLLVSICPVLSAKEIAVGQLVSDHLDTESSTNVAFNVRRNDVKVFDVRIEQASSASNCVQVAFGRDADADGDLSPDEADLVLGWRAGRYLDFSPYHATPRWLSSCWNMGWIPILRQSGLAAAPRLRLSMRGVRKCAARETRF